MKIKYTHSVNMHSNGIDYTEGHTYDVTAEEGTRLINTFSGRFEEVVEPKPKAKPAPKAKQTASKE